MEKHNCKLCCRSFSNGRALGGHMRSHMINLPIPPKPHLVVVEEENKLADSASSRSEQHFPRFNNTHDEDDDEEEEEEVSDDKSLFYGLRENPKRSVKLVDPEFSIMILQDGESETESSRNPTRRRSKRARRSDWSAEPEPEPEPEPASSISDATTEEDVAFCLMMMSRDNWIKNLKNKKKKKRRSDDEDEEEFENYEEYEEDEEEEEEESEFEGGEKRQELSTAAKCSPKGKYKCETCDKVFKSYQALGGHRASHKKLRLTNPAESERRRDGNAVSPEKTKSHQCPICLRVFASGQALGGHKRSHVIAADASSPAKPKPKPIVASATRSDSIKFAGENLIDLNLPAPDYDEDETSQVSDAEFVNRAIIRQ